MRRLTAGAVLTTITACWPTIASPAPAPAVDGRIAFTSVGVTYNAEIFSVDVATGRRKNLTRHRAFDGDAVLSPDGRTVLFRSMRDNSRSIWRMNADGGGQRALVVGSEPAWSPDGKRIVFVDATREALATMAPDGRDVRRLTAGGSLVRSPAWSPDGQFIAYLDGSSVMIVGAAGTGARRIYSVTSASAPMWSPDSTRLAFSAFDGLRDESRLVVVPVAGEEARTLTEGHLDVDARWAPDGRRLAFVRANLDLDGERRSGRIHTVDASGGEPAPIVRAPAGFNDSSPSWSPDGRLLGFARGRDVALRQLWVVPARGGVARRVRREDGPVEPPVVWSADSRLLLYSHEREYNDRDIYTVAPDGSQLRRLTTSDTDEYDPSFSPDGRWIVFVRIVGESRELFLMRADGSGLRRLTRSGGLAPSWSPDGGRIVFVRHAFLYTIRPDGTHLVKLRARGEFWNDPAWSPDGRWIAVTGETKEGGGEEQGGILHLLTAEGRHRRKLAEFDGAVAHYPAWAPSGDRVSFVREETCLTCEGGDLWSVGRGGGRPRLLARVVADFAWSPAGTRFVRLVSGELFVSSITGRLDRRVAAPRGGGRPGLSWQPRCTLGGSARGDGLRARASSELVCGFGGHDRLVGGPGRDRLLGGDGNDSIDARGGGHDVVGCGAGVDTVHADPADYVGVDCERVRRR